MAPFLLPLGSPTGPPGVPPTGRFCTGAAQVPRGGWERFAQAYGLGLGFGWLLSFYGFWALVWVWFGWLLLGFALISAGFRLALVSSFHSLGFRLGLRLDFVLMFALSLAFTMMFAHSSLSEALTALWEVLGLAMNSQDSS